LSIRGAALRKGGVKALYRAPGRNSQIAVPRLIVATSHDGSTWAIQSKCYSGSVPSGEIDSFIAASARPEFDRRLLISSGEITKHSHTKLTNNDKPSSLLLYEQLDERNLNWMAYLDQSVPHLTERKHPYPHQDTVIKDVLQGLEATI